MHVFTIDIKSKIGIMGKTIQRSKKKVLHDSNDRTDCNTPS